MHEDDYTNICPICGCSLEEQVGYSEFYEDYTCSECFTNLHRDYIFEEWSPDEECDDPNYGAAIGIGLVGGFLLAHFIHKASSESQNEETQSQPKRIEYKRDISDEELERRRIIQQQKRTEQQIKIRKRIEKTKTLIKKCFSIYKKRHFVINITVITLVLVVFLSIRIIEYTKSIPISYSSDSLLGEDYNDTIRKFEMAGFTRIETYPNYDLDMDDISIENTVYKIKIRGKSDFDNDSKFPYYARIKVYYHTLKKIPIPVSSNKAKKMDYTDLVGKLEKAGFVNITTIPDCDLVTGWITKDGSVESMKIDYDEDFSQNDLFRPDVRIYITYHTFKD